MFWRRDALSAAITGHASELVLRTLAGRASQLGLEHVVDAELRSAAGHMSRSWKAWREVTSQWDIVSTGAFRGVGVTPVAAEIGDLALRAGQLAYRNLRWTPACSDASLTRDPADLAQAPGDVIRVLAAVHHAADAISQIAATDRQAVIAAADDRRLHVPVRLLSDKYDIPYPYTLAPRPHADALLAAYDAAADAAACVTAALDDLATAIDAPSSVLAAARRAPAAARYQLPDHREQRPAPAPPAVTPVPGRTEHALLQLQIRDPALLLRAAVIDQAAHDLVAEAAATARSRHAVAIPVSRPAAATPSPSPSPGQRPALSRSRADPQRWPAKTRRSRRTQGRSSLSRSQPLLRRPHQPQSHGTAWLAVPAPLRSTTCGTTAIPQTSPRDWLLRAVTRHEHAAPPILNTAQTVAAGSEVTVS